jgi:hypothetical protein
MNKAGWRPGRRRNAELNDFGEALTTSLRYGFAVSSDG